MTPLITEMVRLVPEPETAHWFDLGTVPAHVPAMRVELDRMRHMPYPRTCCVFRTAENDTRYAVWLLTGDNSVTVAYVAHDPGNRPLYSRALSITEVGGQLTYRVGGSLPQDDKAVKNVTRVLMLVALRLHESSEAYRPQAMGTPAQQAKRKRHGKAPLFSWHTVHITPPAPSPPATTDGGTHASPRLHDRRGHWRTYKATGKKVWVRNCTVGDASRGVVFKDYEVKQ